MIKSVFTRKNWKNGKKRYIDLQTALPTKVVHETPSPNSLLLSDPGDLFFQLELEPSDVYIQFTETSFVSHPKNRNNA